MIKLFSHFFLLSLFAQFAVAGTAKITGTVQDTDSKKYLSDVIVKIQGTDISDKTDDGGAFLLNHLEPGKYYLVFIKTGFYSLVIPDIQVTEEAPVLLKAEMYPGDETQFLFLEIGGIQVTADRELLSEEAQTVHKISSGEIEHMQANSLSDVLDMIPGNEKTANLGLGRKQSINLRTLNDPNDSGELFGTKVVVDDVPLTNNADLQTGVGVNYGSKVQSTAGSQYDLREVVAENLEKVEVQSGASSVEYGDHTTGLILVNTKTRNVPTRLKIKHNPDTQEANLMGGFGLMKTDFIYNFNYGYSERDIRISGDEYQRISGSLKSKNMFWNDKLDISQSLKYSRKLEENNYTIDSTATKAYNRDHHLTYSQRFNYKFNEVSNFYLRNYIDYKRRNSWYNKLEVSGSGYQTDRTTEGTEAGKPIDLVYRSDVRTIGDEWSYGSKFKWDRKLFTGDILHRLLTGAEFQTDRNTGPGKKYDPLKAPGGVANTRPRSFNEVPGITQLALFSEDRISGEFLFPFTFDFGFRLDSYNPSGFDFGNLFSGKDAFKADQGTFFNPRIGLKLKPFAKTQLRFSYGKSSKMPSLSMIYPEAYYLDSFGVTDSTINYINSAGVERDTTVKWSIISTSIYDRTQENLKGYQTTKYEFSLDQQIGPLGLSLTAFFKYTDNIPRSTETAHSYDRYEWPNWPDTTRKVLLETVLLGRSKYDVTYNLRNTKTNGLEFSLRTHRIPSLNMRFHVNGAYTFSKYGTKNYKLYSSSSREFTAGDSLASGWLVPRDMEIIPYYEPHESWRQRLVMNYNIDYIAESLGIWFTFKAQNVLLDRDLDIITPKPHAAGYYENGNDVEIDAETSTLMELDRTYDPLDLTADIRPNDKWLFSVVASKSVFKGAEVSLFIENVLDDAAYYTTRNDIRSRRNPQMFWGLAFSSKLDGLFK